MFGLPTYLALLYNVPFLGLFWAPYPPQYGTSLMDVPLPKTLARYQAGTVTYLLKTSSMNSGPASQSESQILIRVHCCSYGQGTQSQIKNLLGKIILALEKRPLC